MKTSFSPLLPVLILIISFGCNSNQPKSELHKPASSDNKVSVESMHKDLAILYSAIKEIHPGYGFYTSTDSMQSAYNKTYASIQIPLTESQFITAMYPFLCSLRCGHTQIKHSLGFDKSAQQPANHLPFHVLVQQHRAWVTTSNSEQLTTGDEILSVNKIPVKDIVDHGYEFYNDDGYNETFKELFLSEYDGFEDVCNLYYHLQTPYHLDVRDSSGALKTVDVTTTKSGAASKVKQVDNYIDWTTENSIPDARLRFLNKGSVALFQSPPFAYSDTTVFKNAFHLIHKTGSKTLILDMRYNSGGDIRVATQLLSYLADTSFQIIKDVTSRLPDLAANSFAKYFDTSITQGFALGFKTTYKEGSWYHIEATPAFGNLYGAFPIDKAAHFNGKLIVLIGPGTFSSGALATAAIKAQRKGVIFIGRETAGSEEGCNGVTLQKLTLPNTKVVIDFPWMRVMSMAANATPGRGIMPDYIIQYSPNDIVTQRDLDLQKALDLVR